MIKIVRLIFPFLLLTLISNTTFAIVSYEGKELKETTHSARKLGFKTKETINRYAQFSKQILKADTAGMKMLDKIVETSQKVKPKLGEKYVKSLPQDFKYRSAFDGYAKQGAYQPGELLFQAQRQGQKNPGNWFSPVKLMDSGHAEDMLFIKKYGNDGSQIKAYIVKEKVSGYAGKVTDGSGYQFYIPEGSDLSEILEEVILD